MGNPEETPFATWAEMPVIPLLQEVSLPWTNGLDSEPLTCTPILESMVGMTEPHNPFELSYRELADAEPQLVWTADPDGEVDYWNQRWYEYTGFKSGEGMGWTWMNAIHPDDVEKAIRIWKQSIETGETYENEYRFRRCDGGYLWFFERGIPVRDLEGRIVKWVGTCTDIQKTKEAEEARLQILARLKKSEEQLAEAQQLTHIGSWETEIASGRVSWSNEQYRLFGLEPQSIDPVATSGSFMDFPEDRIHRDELRRQALQDHQPYSFERRIIHADGSVRILHNLARIILDEEGRPVRLHGTTQDVTEIRGLQMEKEKLQQQKIEALQQADRLKDEFLSVISHELRTPLNAVLAFGSLLEDGDAGVLSRQQKD